MHVTEEIRRLRAKWLFRGSARPAFADVPGEGQESVWDYPRPPRIELDSRRIRVAIGDRLIAESTRSARVLETAGAPTHYLPRDDVRMEFLSQNDSHCLCEWKGMSVGFDLNDGSRNVAWSYPETFPEFEAIVDWVAFYPSKVECYVDDERARPQPGLYYGGWVTHEIVGPFKGDDRCDGL